MKSTGKKLLIVFFILQSTKCIFAQKPQMTAEMESESVADVIISEDIEVEATPVLVAITENTDIQITYTESGVNTPINVANAPSTILAEFPIQDANSESKTNRNNNDAVDTTNTANSDTSEIVTEAQPIDTTIMAVTLTTKTPSKQCLTAGNFPHESNCHLYYTCSLTTAEGELNLVEQSCPYKTAFNMDYGRCMRDSYYCPDGITCDRVGTFADAQSNSSYYWCLSRFMGGFHKYHVQCATGQVFMPELGRCFIDINNLQNLPPNFAMSTGELDDENAIKAELKQIKTEEKVQMKQQKLKEKLEKKLQKELAKKAIKGAKEKANIKNLSKEN